jgi:hypothetical protein
MSFAANFILTFVQQSLDKSICLYLTCKRINLENSTTHRRKGRWYCRSIGLSSATVQIYKDRRVSMERNVNHHHKQPSQSLLNQTLKATSFLPTAKMRFSALNLLALASSAAAFSGQISDWLEAGGEGPGILHIYVLDYNTGSTYEGRDYNGGLSSSGQEVG